jgi:hypothetical protein
MATLQFAGLGGPVVIPSTVGAVYTVPASTTVYIKTMIVHNTNTSAETVTIHVVPNSGGSVGTAAAANRIYNFALSGGESLTIELSFPITLTAQNDTIQAATTTASKVNILFLGSTAI